MQSDRVIRIFLEMLREEWRLHVRYFTRHRFALFPLIITLLVGGTIAALVEIGMDIDRMFGGLHVLALLFGLHTGSAALIGRDSIHNLLGDVTLLVFSVRTLPLSQRQLVGIFVIKDVCYYALLFLLPMVIGTGAVLLALGIIGPVSVVQTGALLWLTLTGMFVLGLVSTVAGIGVLSRQRSLDAVVGILGIAAVAGYLASHPGAAMTPYGTFSRPTAGRFLAPLLLIVLIGLVGVVTFETSSPSANRRVEPLYRRLQRRIGTPVATRSLMDLHRSAGGFGKALFSAVVLLIVTVILVEFAGSITGVSPSVGIAFGAILGLTGFTTYNWLTQFDDVGAYRTLPLDAEAIFHGKFIAFLLTGPTIGIGIYVPGVVWRGGRLVGSLVGGVLLVGIACYIFGVTVSLTGLSPNEFLFDMKRFVMFGLAMVTPLVPILVVGFVVSPLSIIVLASLCVVGIGLGIVGIALYRRAVPKWTIAYRS